MIELTAPQDLRSFVPFLPPHLVPYLDRLPAEAVVYEARIHGTRAGAALALPRTAEATGTIYDLRVAEPFRNLGIGTRLLQKMEYELGQAGCTRIRIDRAVNDAADSAADDFFRHRQYTAGRSLYRMAIMRSRELAAQPWAATATLKNGFTLTPWTELTEEERFLWMQNKEVCAGELSPFRNEISLDPETSCILRYRGRVAGWLITQRLAQNMLMFRTLYTLPEFQQTGQGFAMVVDVAHRFNLVNRYPYFMFVANESNRRMIRLFEKRLEVAAVRTKRMIRFEKDLSVI